MYFVNETKEHTKNFENHLLQYKLRFNKKQTNETTNKSKIK